MTDNEMIFEEWWDRPEGCGATPGTYKGWEKYYS